MATGSRTDGIQIDLRLNCCGKLAFNKEKHGFCANLDHNLHTAIFRIPINGACAVTNSGLLRILATRTASSASVHCRRAVVLIARSRPATRVLMEATSHPCFRAHRRSGSSCTTGKALGRWPTRVRTAAYISREPLGHLPHRPAALQQRPGSPPARPLTRRP